MISAKGTRKSELFLRDKLTFQIFTIIINIMIIERTKYIISIVDVYLFVIRTLTL